MKKPNWAKLAKDILKAASGALAYWLSQLFIN